MLWHLFWLNGEESKSELRNGQQLMNVIWFCGELLQVTCRKAVSTLQSKGRKPGLLTFKPADDSASLSWDRFGAKSCLF